MVHLVGVYDVAVALKICFLANCVLGEWPEPISVGDP